MAKLDKNVKEYIEKNVDLLDNIPELFVRCPPRLLPALVKVLSSAHITDPLIQKGSWLCNNFSNHELTELAWAHNPSVTDSSAALKYILQNWSNFYFDDYEQGSELLGRDANENELQQMEPSRQKLIQASKNVKCNLSEEIINDVLNQYRDYRIDYFIEEILNYCGDILLNKFPNMLFWEFAEKQGISCYNIFLTSKKRPDKCCYIYMDEVYDI